MLYLIAIDKGFDDRFSEVIISNLITSWSEPVIASWSIDQFITFSWLVNVKSIIDSENSSACFLLYVI